MKAFVISLYSLVMFLEVSIFMPALQNLVQSMAEKQEIITQVFAEWGW